MIGSIPLSDVLLASGALFSIGIAGVLLRRNAIQIFLSIELMMNAANLALLGYGAAMGTHEGQVIVYAGAILVLFLFVLMLLNIGHIPAERSGPLQTLLGSLGVILFAALLLGTLRGAGAIIPAPTGETPQVLSDPVSLSRELFSKYLLHFEAISVLLLAALVGAFVLARREKRP